MYLNFIFFFSKERVLKSGGMITTDSVGRSLVNGRLAMTRSLGDLDLKPFGVTAQPDTRSLEVCFSYVKWINIFILHFIYVYNSRDIGW